MKHYFLIFSLFLFFCAASGPEACAGRRFDELVRALQSEKIPKIVLNKIVAKHLGRNIEGRAYIVNIGEDVSGRKAVTMNTEKDPDKDEAVGIVVYLRKGFERSLLRLKQASADTVLGHLAASVCIP